MNIRKSKYRKNVETDVLDTLPEPGEGEEIVRILGSRGGNLLEVEAEDETKALCRLPQRYRKVVRVKRGMLLIVQACTDDHGGENGKVKYVVSHVIFTPEQTRNLRNKGILPARFDTDTHQHQSQARSEVDNRRRQNDSSSSDENSSEDDDDEEEQEEEEDEEENETDSRGKRSEASSSDDDGD